MSNCWCWCGSGIGVDNGVVVLIWLWWCGIGSGNITSSERLQLSTGLFGNPIVHKNRPTGSILHVGKEGGRRVGWDLYLHHEERRYVGVVGVDVRAVGSMGNRGTGEQRK